MHNPALRMPSEEDLHEIRLEDEPVDLEALHRLGARPKCFRSGFHELCFVVFATIAASSFLVLQRTTTIMSNMIKLDLDMTASQVAWTTGGSGCVPSAFSHSVP